MVNFHKMSRTSEDFENCIKKAKDGKTIENPVADQPSTSTSKNRYNYLTLTPELKRKYGLSNERFSYYYEDVEEMFKDFVHFLINSCSKASRHANQTVQSLRAVWEAVDPKLNLKPNHLKFPEKIEDNYVLPHIEKLKSQDGLEGNKQSGHLKATTIQVKLASVNELLKFSKLRFVYLGINSSDMDLIKLKIQQMCQLLKPFRLKRY